MALETFHYTHDGKKFTLPKMKNLKFGVTRKMRKADDDEKVFMLIESVADDKALEIIDDMTVEQLGELMEAWQADSNDGNDGDVRLGES